MREGALVREVERALPKAYYEQEAGPFVREVEDVLMESPNLKFGCKCWMCDDRWFNNRKQLVDHIEGSGQGGKAHMKYRRRWVAAGQMCPLDWADFLKQEKEKEEQTGYNASCTVAAPSTMSVALQSDFDAVETCYMPGPPQVFYENYDGYCTCYFDSPILQ